MIAKSLALFEGYGIELEYMIVDQETLNIRAITDKVIRHIAGSYVNEVEMGSLAWSNELVLHVIELKTNGPAKELNRLDTYFQSDVSKINEILNHFNACLMPTAMHPWMNPHEEMQLWPHGYNPIYSAYDRIFNCKGHGWSNLQSMHINLPFANDDEFAKLHAAIRIILPILPALSASSPIVDGQWSGFIDKRLDVYRSNAIKIPSISGLIIPEPLFTKKDYEEKLLERLYRDIAPYDVDAELQEEWLNSRGAIARFERNAIEIRLVDVQECPWADIAIATLISTVLKELVEERWISLNEQKNWQTEGLSSILLETIKNGDSTIIENKGYLSIFGLRTQTRLTAAELWQHLYESVCIEKYYQKPLENIFQKGSLSRRIIDTLGQDFSQKELFRVYQSLSQCLAKGELFFG